MENIITPELISTVTTLLTLFVAGVPIGFLTFVFVQVGKWAGLFGSFSGFQVRRAALAHAGLLGALWIAIQFFPSIVPVVSIVILGLYGAMVAALTYDKVWSKIAGALGINYASEHFALAADQRDRDGGFHGSTVAMEAFEEAGEGPGVSEFEPEDPALWVE